MTSRCILTHIQKLPRSNNSHFIKRNINLTSYGRNEVVKYNVAALQHCHYNPDNRHYSSTTYKNSSSQQQEPSMFDRVKSNLGLSKKESDEAAQFNRLASMETFTIKDFQQELENTRTWKQKLFGSILDKENKERVDKILKLVKVIASEVSTSNKQLTSILEIGRKEKVRICIKTNDDSITLDDVNEVLQLYNNMEFMHRLLRYRKVNGKGIPDDEEGMRLAAEEDQKHVVTNREKKIMKQKMMRGAMRKMK